MALRTTRQWGPPQSWLRSIHTAGAIPGVTPGHRTQPTIPYGTNPTDPPRNRSFLFNEPSKVDSGAETDTRRRRNLARFNRKTVIDDPYGMFFPLCSIRIAPQLMTSDSEDDGVSDQTMHTYIRQITSWFVFLFFYLFFLLFWC